MIIKSTMPHDFWNWLERYKMKYPNSRFRIEDAMDAYNERFPCKCESCNYQKEHGHWPMRIGPDCTLPIDACVAELHPKHVMYMP
jgi:hypothetical protein